jgi:ABC-type amino acid transport substrate-binding protein
VGHPDLYRIKAARVKLHRRTLLLGSVALIGMVPVSIAQTTGSPGDTLDEITTRGTITIGLYDDYAPYSYFENGEIKGTDAEIGKLIAEALGVKAVLDLRRADENVDADLRDHIWRGPVAGGDVVNLFLHMPIDRELALRNDMVVMGGAYASEKTVLTWSKTQLGDIPTMTDFTEYKIAVENDSIADFYLSGLAGGGIVKNMLHEKSMGEAMDRMFSGEAAGAMGPMAQIEFALSKISEKAKFYGVGKTVPAGLGQGTWSYGFAVRMNYRDLYYAVEEALANAIADGRIKAIYEKYGLSFNPPPPPKEE